MRWYGPCHPWIFRFQYEEGWNVLWPFEAYICGIISYNVIIIEIYTCYLRAHFTKHIRSTHVYSLMFVDLHEIKVLTQMRTRYITNIRVVTVRTTVASTRCSKYKWVTSQYQKICLIEVMIPSLQVSVSLWNMTGSLVSMLLSSQFNIFVTRSLETHISWVRELTW